MCESPTSYPPTFISTPRALADSTIGATFSFRMRLDNESAETCVPRNIFSHLTTRKTDHPTPRTPSQAKSVSKVIKADIYPEFGTYPGGGESPIIPFGSEKNAEREVIHGRWAMLNVTRCLGDERRGILVSPPVPSAPPTTAPPSPTSSPAPSLLAPEGSGYPSFWAVLAIEVVLVGAGGTAPASPTPS